MRRIQDGSSTHREQSPGLDPPNNLNESSTIINKNVWEIGTTHTDGRIRVDVIDKVLEPSNTCSHKITNIIYERLEPTGFNWKAVSKETKAFYFEEFKYFIWKPELSENVVQDAWLQNARTRYSNLCSTAHGRWEKNKPRNNRIGLAVWESWVQHWNTPEFMKKSNIQKGNRNSGVDGHPSTHTGGSRSHKTHAADLAKELKRKPHPRQVFKRTHFKHGKWVDKESELINEAIEEHLKQHSENVDDSLESQPIDELEVYIDVVGGRTKKNIVYGISSSQTLFYGSGKGHSSGACSTSQLQNGDHQMMQKKLVDMENQMKVMREDQEQHLKAMHEHQQEQLKAIQLEHQERLDMLENRLAKMMQSHSFGRTNLP